MPTARSRITGALVALALASSPSRLLAQGQASDSVRASDTTTAPVRQAAPSAPAVELSGVMYASYQYRGDAAAASANRFDLERVYLTVRSKVGDRVSVRATADVFQQQSAPADAYYRGWTFRAKYAYLQYDLLRSAAGAPGLNANLRGGMLHNVVIEHVEQHWPRWISTTATDRFGFFSSSDLGAALTVSLPRRIGEVYATAVNGPGYTSRETDRFKDYAARLSLTPLAGRVEGLAATLTLTAWAYRGAIASRFVTGGAGQVGAVGEGLRRDRRGLFLAIRDPRLTLAAEWAQRDDEGETGANTTGDPRVVRDSTGRLVSGFAIVRPMAWIGGAAAPPLALVGRWDRVRQNVDGNARADLIIAGATYDLSRKVSVGLDYQELTPRSGASLAGTKTYYARFVANF